MLTLEDLKSRCDDNNIPYAYGSFPTEVTPPFLTATIDDSNNFTADNSVYCKVQEVSLVFTYLKKDEELERLIEDTILEDVVWRKESEFYYFEEKVWQTRYFFQILKD